MVDDSEEEEDFGALLAEFEASSGARRERKLSVGEKVEGRVVAIGEENVFVDVGAKAEASLAIAEVTDDDGELTVALGATITAMVAALDPDTGAPVLRLKAGHGAAAAEELRQAHAASLPVEGLVTAVNKGGVEVEIGGVRAFCPISQLDARYVEQPEGYVGQKLTFRVTRFEEGGRGRGPNVVVSRRVLIEEEAKARAAETRKLLEVGKVLEGKVTSLTNYGAFVDLGGIEGLLHVSEISHTRVGHPEEVLSEGQSVRVQIKSIEPGKDGQERVSLSRKALDQDPWEGIAERFPQGHRARGRVVRLAQFGAFVELAPGVDGLLHISELGEGRRLSHPREVLTVGDEIDVVVQSVEADRKRISLRLDRDEGGSAEEREPREAADSAAPAYDDHRPPPAPAGGSFAALGDVLQDLKNDLEKRDKKR